MSVNGQAAAGVTVPDTKLAREATELARETTTDLIYHHSRRVYWWGSVHGRNRGPSFARRLGFAPAPGVPTRKRTPMTRLLRRMLSALRRERAGREEIERLAGDQVALRRVAALVALRRVAALAARAAAPEEVSAAVAEELAQLPGADIAVVLRYEAGGAATVLGCWGGSGVPAVVGRRLAVAGEGVAVSVRQAGQPARFAGPPGSVAGSLRRAGMRAGSVSPVVVDGRVWGVVITAAARPGQLSPEAEHWQAAFAELIAAASRCKASERYLVGPT
jgi:hypothetical protein